MGALRVSTAAPSWPLCPPPSEQVLKARAGPGRVRWLPSRKQGLTLRFTVMGTMQLLPAQKGKNPIKKIRQTPLCYKYWLNRIYFHTKDTWVSLLSPPSPSSGLRRDMVTLPQGCSLCFFLQPMQQPSLEVGSSWLAAQVGTVVMFAGTYLLVPLGPTWSRAS